MPIHKLLLTDIRTVENKDSDHFTSLNKQIEQTEDHRGDWLANQVACSKSFRRMLDRIACVTRVPTSRDIRTREKRPLNLICVIAAIPRNAGSYRDVEGFEHVAENCNGIL